jgi:hypothetical protein
MSNNAHQVTWNANWNPHGEAGHINVLVKDQDSEITGYGKHCRLVVGRLVEGGDIVCREDIKWGLPLSNEAQRRKVIRKSGLLPKRMWITLVSSDHYESSLGHEAIEHYYKVTY